MVQKGMGNGRAGSKVSRQVKNPKKNATSSKDKASAMIVNSTSTATESVASGSTATETGKRLITFKAPQRKQITGLSLTGDSFSLQSQKATDVLRKLPQRSDSI